MLKNKNCNYCGWKIPADFIQKVSEKSGFVFCENCGTELISENPIPNPIKSENNNQDLIGKKKKKTISNIIYEKLRIEKNPIARVLRDSDFIKTFKDNFLLVMSRVIYYHLRTLGLETVIEVKAGELTKHAAEKLYKEISPVFSKRFKRVYLENLHKMDRRDFEKWLIKLHTKLKLNKNFHNDFVLYLRWLINEVYIIISEFWDITNLPKFERIIRDDLKEFCFDAEKDKNFSTRNKEFDLENEKSNTQKFVEKEDYINFLEILRSEIAKLVSAKELHRNRLANWRLAKYLDLPFGQRKDGRKWDAISTIFKGERHLTIEDLEKSKKSLQKFFGKKASDCINIINNFLTDKRLRRYSKQQWQDHNPNLNESFFKGLRTEFYSDEFMIPSYWYGFMGSDASVQSGFFEQSVEAVRDHRFRYQITIELSIKDRNLLIQFCENIGLDPLRIKERTREKWGKKYLHAYITFNCREMTEDLGKLGLISSKENRKGVPEYIRKAMVVSFEVLKRKYTGPKHIASTPSGRIALGWLRGAYDGDGHSDRTELGSASKMFLESIKKTFKIKYPVRPHHSAPDFWILTLGARLYNAMTSVCKEFGIGLERKDFYFSENREALFILIENLEDLKIGRDELQNLVFKSRLYQLTIQFKTSTETLRKLLNEWNIELPPNGYWTTRKKKVLN